MESLPRWLSALPDAETMRAIDRWAIEQQGVPGVELMERAGEGVARAVERLAPDGAVVVFCGKGNNGGDGLVAARLLRQAGRDVSVALTCEPRELAGDARANLERLPGHAPLALAQLSPATLASATLLVDALLGTGFAGAPRGSVAEAIVALNSAPAPVLSVDVPSGVDASSGAVQGTAVRAAATVTFHASKPGLWIRPGKAYAGEVQRIDIGIPRGWPGGSEIGLIERQVLELLPRRAASSTKFSSGHVLVVGGSRGLTGAPRMAAYGAMRTGAGYVSACVPAGEQPIVAMGRPELMTRALAEEDGGLSLAAAAAVLESLSGVGAIALGPGLGRSAGAFDLARELAQRAEVALVLDADGLNAHAGRLAELARRAAPTVLTPHAGELARLLGLNSAEIESERLRHVRAAAALAGAVVVLKGDDTLIADPDGRVAVSPGGSPALATAGTGDVLCGVLAALMAQGMDPFAAAAAGVWLHLAAGREAARRCGSAEGVLASDVIEALPSARRASAHGSLPTNGAGGRADGLAADAREAR